MIIQALGNYDMAKFNVDTLKGFKRILPDDITVSNKVMKRFHSLQHERDTTSVHSSLLAPCQSGWQKCWSKINAK